VSRIGIMQGRLLPPVGDTIQAFPVDHWAEEFPRAAAAELAAIEWIYDAPDRDRNPLSTDAGLARIAELSATHGVAVRSVCADYFMTHPLLRAADGVRAERVAHLEWLIARCRAARINRLVLPFVDGSAVRTETDESQVVDVLRSTCPVAAAAAVELHVEMTFGPREFARFLALVQHPALRVNYDSGNSASLGYDPREEFAAYGDFIGSVHIKDRVKGGGTVPLGRGDTDLRTVFAELRKRAYAGDFVLQVARGASGNEVAWAKANRAHVMALLA
jgi:L-ribulose-5-phosphate 3-epimerase